LTASGCAPTVMDYGRLLQHDPRYAKKADRLASIAQDISAFLEHQDLDVLGGTTGDESLIAFHSPCTLQHGLKRAGSVEALLSRLGFRLPAVIPYCKRTCLSSCCIENLNALNGIAPVLSPPQTSAA